jgi:hypothetical protein
VIQAAEVLKRIELSNQAKITKREERAAYLEILGIDADDIANEMEEEREREKEHTATDGEGGKKRKKSLGSAGSKPDMPSTPTKTPPTTTTTKKQGVLDEGAREAMRREDAAVEEAVFGEFEVDDMDGEGIVAV